MAQHQDRSAEIGRFLFEECKGLAPTEISRPLRERFGRVSLEEYQRGEAIAKELLEARIAEGVADIDVLKAYCQARKHRPYDVNDPGRVERIVVLLKSGAEDQFGPTAEGVAGFLRYLKAEVPGTDWPEVAQAHEIHSGVVWMEGV